MTTLKERLDAIDEVVYGDVFKGYYESRLRLLIGMWEKGEAVGSFRGVKDPISFYELEKMTGRNHAHLKRWHELYIKWPDKQKYIDQSASIRARNWTNRAIGPVKEPEQSPQVTKDLLTATTEDIHALVNNNIRFGTIYADPPWLYSNQGTRAATSNHYGGMTVEELCELPIRELTKDDSFLHLWTTNAFLFSCPKIMESWGFEYRSVFVWVKPQMGIGNYWRVSHEFLILGRRGNPTWKNRGLMSWDSMDRTVHSAKPEKVREMIESACEGPYLELFGRKPSPGWVVWGNEIERNMFESSIKSITQ